MFGNYPNNHTGGWNDMSFSGFSQGQLHYHERILHDRRFQYPDSRYSPHQMPEPAIPAVAPVQCSQSVVCEICEVRLPRKNMEQHKNGKRHQRMLQQQIEELMMSKTSNGQESIRIPNSQMNPVVQPKKVPKSKKNGCSVEVVSHKGPFFNFKDKGDPAEGSEKKLRDNTSAKDCGFKVENVSYEGPIFKNKKVPAEGSERKLKDNTGEKDHGFKRKIGEPTGGKYMKMDNGIRKPMKSSKPEVNARSNSLQSLVQAPELTPPSRPVASPITAPTPVVGSSQFQHVSASLTQVSKGKEHQEIRKPTVETNDQPQSTPVELQASAGSNISAGTEDMSSDFAVIAIAQPQSPITSQVFTPPPSVGSSFEPKNQIDSQTEVSEGEEHHEIQNRAVETKDQPQSISMEFDAPAGSNVSTLTECMCSDSDAIVIAPPQGHMASQVCTLPSAVGSSFEPKNQLVLLSEMSEGKDCNEIQNHTVDSNDQPPSISVELHNLAGSNINTKTEDANSDSAAIEIAPLSFASPQEVGSSLEPQTEHVLHTEIEPQVSKAIAYYERQHPAKETDVQLLPSVLMEFDAPSGVSFNTQTADGSSKDETKMGVLATELGITQLSQVSVCLKCGDKGFLETLVFCNNCQVYGLHRYCLDGPVIITDNVTWFCEDCEANEVDTDSHNQCALVPFGTSYFVNLENDTSQAIIELTNCREREFHKEQQQNICEAKVVETSSDQRSLLQSERSDGANSAKDESQAIIELTNCIECEKGNKQEQQNIAEEEEEELNKDWQLVPIGEANSSEGYVSLVDPQPIADPIWRGGLYLYNQSFGTITGLLAHLSNLACSRVLEETRLFPEVLCADLLQRSAVWPKSFMECGLKNDSIALYFLPENERVERAFDNLVDEMISHDLAIRAVVENAELLVFPSTVLPVQYRRFQARYYLWGVFKAKQTSPKTNDAVSEEDAKCLNQAIVPLML